MINNILYNWIKDELKNGKNPQEIYNYLIQKGFNQAELNEVFTYIYNSSENINNNNDNNKQKIYNKSIYLIIGLILFLVIGFLSYSFLFNNNNINTINNKTNNLNFQQSANNNMLSNKSINDSNNNINFNELNKNVSNNINNSSNNLTNSSIIHVHVNQTYEIKNTTNKSVGNIKTDIDVDILIKSSCGSEKCFEEKFAKCQPASMNSTMMEGLTYHYQIIGPKDGYCQVSSKFLANPNPEFVNKTMICEYNNSLNFMDAIKDMSRCHGELYDLFTGSK